MSTRRGRNGKCDAAGRETGATSAAPRLSIGDIIPGGGMAAAESTMRAILKLDNVPAYFLVWALLLALLLSRCMAGPYWRPS